MRFARPEWSLLVFSSWLPRFNSAYCRVGDTVWAVVPGYTARVPAVINKILSDSEYKVSWVYSLDFCLTDSSRCIVSIDKVWDRFGTRCSTATLSPSEDSVGTTTTVAPTPPQEAVPLEEEKKVNLTAIIPAVVLLGLAGLLWLCISRRRRPVVTPFALQLTNHFDNKNKSPASTASEVP